MASCLKLWWSCGAPRPTPLDPPPLRPWSQRLPFKTKTTKRRSSLSWRYWSITDQQTHPVTHGVNLCATFSQTWKIFQRSPVKGRNKGDSVAAVTATTSRSRDRKVTLAVVGRDCPLFCSCLGFSLHLRSLRPLTAQITNSSCQFDFWWFVLWFIW